MITPRWVRTRTQPIAVDDAVKYLIGVLDPHDTASHCYEIGGPEVLRYVDMLRRVAVIEGRTMIVVPVPVLSSALFARFRSRSGNTFGEKLLSAMRFQFGGHVEQLPGDTKPAEVKHEDAVKKGG